MGITNQTPELFLGVVEIITMIKKTKKETLLRIAALTIIIRDDLEDIDFDKVLKNKANMFLKELNKSATFLASDGNETNEQLMNIVRVFDERLQLK